MTTYAERRDQLQEYFDRTAVKAWETLTSDAPVGRIRATVRAGRDRMRETLLGYLPDDLTGARVLDAGCGTCALAFEAARRGAHVIAVDVSPTLIALGRDRMAAAPAPRGRVDLVVGDMRSPALGTFDFVVAMDSFIHYRPADTVEALSDLAARTEQTIAITFAPRTLALDAMHALGKLFPRGNRAPDIVPVAPNVLRARISAEPRLADFTIGRSDRIESGFYTSQTLELVRR